MQGTAAAPDDLPQEERVWDASCGSSPIETPRTDDARLELQSLIGNSSSTSKSFTAYRHVEPTRRNPLGPNRAIAT